MRYTHDLSHLRKLREGGGGGGGKVDGEQLKVKVHQGITVTVKGNLQNKGSVC